jgi:uncharacterized protein with HEPN domain
MKRDDVYLKHILESIGAILTYTDGIEKEEFLENTLIQDAVLRNLEIIGEATKNLSAQFREQNNTPPWGKMAGMRDKLIHQYMGVDIETVWKTVDETLPGLQAHIEKLIDK